MKANYSTMQTSAPRRQAHHKRKLFNVISSEKGKQLFFKMYAALILSYKHKRGQYLFTIQTAINNFFTTKKVLYNEPDTVHIFFWQAGYDLGVIAKDSMTGKEVFIEL